MLVPHRSSPEEKLACYPSLTAKLVTNLTDVSAFPHATFSPICLLVEPWNSSSSSDFQLLSHFCTPLCPQIHPFLQEFQPGQLILVSTDAS